MRSLTWRMALAITLLMMLSMACLITEALLPWDADAPQEYAEDDGDPDFEEHGESFNDEDSMPDESDQNQGEGEQQGEDWQGLPDDLRGHFLEDALVIYVVQGDQILDPQFPSVSSDMRAYQEDTEHHREIWNLFTHLIPYDNRSYVSGFVVFSDGPEEALAAVDPDPQDPALWFLSIDILDAENTSDLGASLIHEFGHLLTLNAAQVPPDLDVFQAGEDDWETYDEAEAACPTYFTGEGCSQPDSYINAFFGRFWADIYAEWYDIDTEPDEEEYYARLDAFYVKYQDRFVSDYAATNPGEDIAETWMKFILEARPSGDTISEEKILFFYAYPHLVALREHIRDAMP